MIDSVISKIAAENSVKVEFDCPNCARNRAASAGRDTIFLGVFDDPDIKLFAFFHELGHCLFPSDAEFHMCTMSKEGAAWEYGIALAKKYGYTYEYSSKEFEWGRSQLFSYLKSDSHVLESGQTMPAWKQEYLKRYFHDEARQ